MEKVHSGHWFSRWDVRVVLASAVVLVGFYVVYLVQASAHLECIWTNGGDIYEQGMWSESANWSCGHVPTEHENVIFDGTLGSNDDATIDVPTASVEHLTLRDNFTGKLKAGSSTLNVYGNWRNDAGLSAFKRNSSHVIFKGDQNHNIFGATRFNDLSFEIGTFWKIIGTQRGKRQRVHGVFSADGSSGNEFRFRSVNNSGVVKTNGNRGKIDVINGTYGTVEYIDVEHHELLEDNVTKIPVLNPPNSVDLGSAPGWFEVPDHDSDGDGVSDSNEQSGINGGDSNGDGTQDAVQSGVGTTSNSVTGAHTTLDLGGGDCSELTSFDVVSEDSLASSDPSQDYPVGLNQFTISCDDPGLTATITVLYDKVYDTSGWSYKKYNPDTNTYINITSSVTYGTKDVGGTTVTTVMYDVTDGGPLDLDGAANATIVDPSGASEDSSSDSDDADPERASVRKFMSHDNREMLRVVIYGDDFDKDARVKLSGVKSEKTRRKSEEKIVALFDYGEVKARAHHKGRTKLRVSVKNPGGDKNRVDKRIDVTDIDPLAHDKYHRVYKGEKRNAWRVQAIAHAVAKGW